MSALFLAHDEIHVWRCVLAPRGDGAGYLSPEEEAQCAKLRFAHDRQRYREAHLARRTILGMYAQCRPEDVQFACTPAGKPFVNGMPLCFGLNFSASRADGFALLAIARGRHVGVDIERFPERSVWTPIARQMLPGSEAAALLELPEPAASEAFASLWARKEAVLKALGWGLAFGIGAVPALRVRSPAEASCIETLVVNAGTWFVRELVINPGYAAAIAWEGEARTVRSFCYRGAGVRLCTGHAPALTYHSHCM